MTCDVDMFTFSISVEDGDGPCSSPCDADDALTYTAVMRNNSPTACSFETPTTCFVDDVEIEGAGPHGSLVDTYYLACGEAVTTHDLTSGEALIATIPGGVLSGGTYVATANFALGTSLAFGSTTIVVE